MMRLTQSRLNWRPLYRLGVKSCPVCGKPDNCSGARDESGDVGFVYCRRPSENQTGLVGKPGRDGGATFYIGPPRLGANISPRPAPQTPTRKPEPTFYRADADHISDVLSMLLCRLTLRDGHRAKIALRGLFDADRLVLKSAPRPEECEALGDALAKYGLRGVPGFFRQGSRWRLRDLGSGVLIPVRDAQGRIRALLLRRDDGELRYIWLSTPPDKFTDGAGSGAPVHFARPQRVSLTHDVIVTEGCLKANVISYFLNAPVVGVAGTSSFNETFGDYLKAELPDLKRVVIAYDTDQTRKVEVRRALLRLQRVLSRAGLRWKVRTWPDTWKGYDDYLLATCEVQGVAA
jgi:hypothetical protein